MNIIQSYFKGFRNTVQSLRMVTLIYLVTLILGLSLSIPFMSTLKEASGLSLDTAKLLKGFDYTAFKEIMRFHGEGIRTFFGIGFWVSLFFLILSVFLTGGILGRLSDMSRDFSLKSFFGDCGMLFGRFFRLSIYTLLMHLLVAVIVYTPLGLIFMGKFEGGASEKQFFYLFLIFAIIHIIVAIWLLIITDYTRIMLVGSKSKKVLKQFWKALKFVSHRFFGTYGLYLLLLVAPVIILILYFKLSGLLNVASALMILLMLLIQQLFIWLRAGFRVWIFASQVSYYQTHP